MGLFAMRWLPRPDAGPYERTIIRLIQQTDERWFPEKSTSLAFGGPPWLAARVAAETGHPLLPCSGGNCRTTLPGVSIFGAPALDVPPAGRLIVQDLSTGESRDVTTCCHRDLPPHRWVHLTLALAEGLNPNAALDIAAIAALP